MLYFFSLLATILCSLLGLWLRVRFPSKHMIQRVHRSVSQHLALGDYENALRELKPLLAKNLRDADTTLLYVQILRASGESTTALEVINEALTKNPGNQRLELECARSHLQKGDPKTALLHFQNCQTLLRDEDSRCDFATALFATGQVDEAWAAIGDIEKESSSGRLMALAGDCHFHWENYALSINFYQQAQQYGWTNQQTLARTGHSLFMLGSFLAAERCFRKIFVYDSDDLVATLGLGRCLEAQGKFERALMIYQSGKAWDQGAPLLLRQAGICAVYSKQESFAQLYLKEAVDKGIHCPQTLAFLGYSLEAQRKWTQAQAVYVQLSETFPKHVAGYRGLAWLYAVGHSKGLSAEQGRHYASQALELFPCAAGWELLSACEARAGNFTTAHDIHEHLMQEVGDASTQERWRSAMRAIRQEVPLDEHLLPREHVA